MSLFLLACLPGAAQSQQPGSGEGTAPSLLDRALAEHRAGKTAQARKLYAEALPLLRRQGNLQDVARLLHNMSLISIASGDYREALDQSLEAVSIRRDSEDQIRLGRSLTGLGDAWLYLGNYDESRAAYIEALELARQAGDKRGEVNRLNNLGNVDFFQGHYFEALRYYQQALAQVDGSKEEAWNAVYRRRTLTNLAVLHQRLGQYQRALNIYRNLSELPDSSSTSERARILTNIGTLYRRLGDPAKALDQYSLAQELFQQKQHLDGELVVTKNIAIVHALNYSDYPRALESFKRVTELASGSGDRREEAQARIYAGTTLLRMGSPVEAEREFRRAATIARDRGLSEDLWKALLGLSRSRTGGDIEALREAVLTIESIRGELGPAPFKADYLTDKRDVYDDLIGALVRGTVVEEPEIEEIHQLIEKGRSRSFRDWFRDALEARDGNQEDAGSRERMSVLRAEIRQILNRLVEADSVELSTLNLRLAELESEYATLADRSADNLSWVDAPSINELRDQLPDTSVLASFWLADEHMVAIEITARGARVTSRSWAADDSRKLEACRGVLSDPAASDWKRTCDGLAESLLGPLFDGETEVENLIVIPDGALALLPFGALPLRDGRVLLERAGVFYLPSSSLLDSPSPDRSQWAPWKETVLGIGSPESTTEESFSLGSARTWPALPLAKWELMAIDSAFPGRSRLLLEKDASKTAFLASRLRDYSIIHLATHAAIDLEMPLRSRLVFSPPNGRTGADYLFLEEVFDLDLEGVSLVTLSACDTAWDVSSPVDGSQNFSRALLLAGARASLASLWQVSDRASARLMPVFYGFLAEGQTIAEALRRAKMTLMEEEDEMAHPASWAPFVVNGAGNSAVPLPWSWPRLLTVTALLILLLGLLLKALRARAKVA